MRTDGTLVRASIGKSLERKHLEAAWGRAWEAQARAAQAGDYAEAERWYARAMQLGTELATADHAPGKGHHLASPPQ
jgi:hypothetical protein